MKTKHILLVLSLLVISIALPYLFDYSDKGHFEKLAFSFQAISTFASLTTVCIALILYKKLNIDSIVIQRQTEKVLELVDLIKGRVTFIQMSKLTYLVGFAPESSTWYSTEHYKEIAGLALITRIKDFHDYGGKLVDLSRSYWLPKEIREKMDFLKFTGYYSTVSIEDSVDYAKLKFDPKENDDDEWRLITPNLNLRDFHNNTNEPIKIDETFLTVNDYVTSKDSLVNEISDWLKNKTSIDIDLQLDEQNQKEV
jgi:hypothetical protein